MSRTIKQKKTGGKSFSWGCGNNRGCWYCTKNRTYKNIKNEDSHTKVISD
jgi:hypothetical protein